MVLYVPSSSIAPRVSGATIYTWRNLKYAVLSKDPSVPPTVHRAVLDSLDCFFQKPDTEGFGWPYDYLLALSDQERPTAMTPQGRPPHEAVW